MLFLVCAYILMQRQIVVKKRCAQRFVCLADCWRCNDLHSLRRLFILRRGRRSVRRGTVYATDMMTSTTAHVLRSLSSQQSVLHNEQVFSCRVLRATTSLAPTQTHDARESKRVKTEYKPRMEIERRGSKQPVCADRRRIKFSDGKQLNRSHSRYARENFNRGVNGTISLQNVRPGTKPHASATIKTPFPLPSPIPPLLSSPFRVRPYLLPQPSFTQPHILHTSPTIPNDQSNNK